MNPLYLILDDKCAPPVCPVYILGKLANPPHFVSTSLIASWRYKSADTNHASLFPRLYLPHVTSKFWWVDGPKSFRIYDKAHSLGRQIFKSAVRNLIRTPYPRNIRP